MLEGAPVNPEQAVWRLTEQMYVLRALVRDVDSEKPINPSDVRATFEHLIALAETTHSDVHQWHAAHHHIPRHS